MIEGFNSNCGTVITKFPFTHWLDNTFSATKIVFFWNNQSFHFTCLKYSNSWPRANKNQSLHYLQKKFGPSTAWQWAPLGSAHGKGISLLDRKEIISRQQDQYP